MKKIIVSVVNDLVTDQRINRVCTSLFKMGFQVVLVGCIRWSTLKLEPRAYQTKRFKLLFKKSFLFYLEYNIRLFFYLLFHKADIFLSNDTDTLLANALGGFIKGKLLVFDAHEYYTGLPELTGRPLVKKTWKAIERYGIRRAALCYTVNDSIADLYQKDYRKKFTVIRNVPYKLGFNEKLEKKYIGIADETRIIIYQGSVNIDRGLEEAIEAMQYIKSNAILLIAGIGTIFNNLQKLVSEKSISHKVIFLGQLSLKELTKYTLIADIGLSIEKPSNINYIYSLPNKFFDYIQCNVPVLTSGMIELKLIMEKYDIGTTIKSHDPVHIAEQIDFMLADPDCIKLWKQNLQFAANEYCWENEEQKIISIFKSLSD